MSKESISNQLYKEYLSKPYIDASDKELIKKMDKATKSKVFSSSLTFGTAGVRGVRGLGPSLFNKYTVWEVTQGYCDYLKEVHGNNDLKIVIAYDTRINSDTLSLEAAKVFKGNDIAVYFYEKYGSTPELSYAIRELGAQGGLIMTASHNPMEYCGYKAYNNNGCQLVNQESDLVIKHMIENSKSQRLLIAENYELKDIPRSIRDNFIQEIKDYVFPDNSLESFHSELRIGFSSFHGVSLKEMKRCFEEFKNFFVLESQSTYDGEFSTIKKPNPEMLPALSLLIKFGKEKKCDILLGSDPDGDRLGLAVLHQGKYVMINGNDLGAIFTYYLGSTKEDLSINDYLIKSVVTSDFGKEIILSLGGSCLETYTGFKNLGQMIDTLKNQGLNTLLTYEESIGYGLDQFTREKNSFSAALLVAKIATIYKNQNMTLIDLLNDLKTKYGYFQTTSLNYYFEGSNTDTVMEDIMEDIRNNGLGVIKNPLRLNYVRDYEKEGINGETSNLITYYFLCGSSICMRPSGTEPKLKIYLNIKGESQEDMELKLKVSEKMIYQRIKKWLK